jgi:hypothetical protein
MRNASFSHPPRRTHCFLEQRYPTRIRSPGPSAAPSQLTRVLVASSSMMMPWWIRHHLHVASLKFAREAELRAQDSSKGSCHFRASRDPAASSHLFFSSSSEVNGPYTPLRSHACKHLVKELELALRRWQLRQRVASLSLPCSSWCSAPARCSSSGLNQPTKEETQEGPDSARRFTTWQSRPAAGPANESLAAAMQGTRRQTTMIQPQAAPLPI